MKKITRIIHAPLAALTFAWLAVQLAPNGFGVVPPPDGGYPNFTTAEGQNALFSLTTGTGNTAVGWFSLKSVTTGSFNTGVGAGTLALNTGDDNTATGIAALLLNTTGTDNTANGTAALVNNSTGIGNTAVGAFALNSNVDGIGSTAIGYQALQSNTNGFGNTATGVDALSSNTVGVANTAIGFNALTSNIDGIDNTAIGNNALGNSNGDFNTAVGTAALSSPNTTGSNNVALGHLAGTGVTTATDVICIGALVSGANVSGSCYIGNIWNQPGGSQAVYVDADGKLGAQVSSLRFKENIESMDDASQALFALTPVKFHYKREIDRAGTEQFGLVAEEVAEVNPDLVTRDKEGKPYSVRYDQVNAMLLNEFLKEHRTVKDQGAVIKDLKREVANLTAVVKEQAAQIQKLGAQMQSDNGASQVVFNNP